jgi:hypothetical protein
VTTAGVLEQIRQRLLAEAENSLAAADRYRVSKRQGERNSGPIYVRRGLAAIDAVNLLDGVIYSPTPPRRAQQPAAPRWAMPA